MWLTPAIALVSFSALVRKPPLLVIPDRVTLPLAADTLTPGRRAWGPSFVFFVKPTRRQLGIAQESQFQGLGINPSCAGLFDQPFFWSNFTPIAPAPSSIKAMPACSKVFCILMAVEKFPITMPSFCSISYTVARPSPLKTLDILASFRQNRAENNYKLYADPLHTENACPRP